MTKVRFALIIIVVALLAVFWFTRPEPATPKTQVPKSFILSQNDFQNIHQDSNNLDFVRYSVNQPVEQVYNRFLDLLSGKDWKVLMDTKLPEPESYREVILYAEAPKHRVNIYLKKLTDAQTSVEVTYLPK